VTDHLSASPWIDAAANELTNRLMSATKLDLDTCYQVEAIARQCFRQAFRVASLSPAAEPDAVRAGAGEVDRLRADNAALLQAGRDYFGFELWGKNNNEIIAVNDAFKAVLDQPHPGEALLSELDSLRAELARLKAETGEWVLCSERLPEDRLPVFWLDRTCGVCAGWYDAASQEVIESGDVPWPLSRYSRWKPITLPAPPALAAPQPPATKETTDAH
jgi:hypothetical protein